MKSMSKAQGLMKVRGCTVATSVVEMHLVGFEAMIEEGVIRQ